MRRAQIRSPQVRSKVVSLKGGLNENVSSLELSAGELIYSTNYVIEEGSQGGYKSLAGYERYDGQTKPSSIAATDADHAAQDAARAAIGEVETVGTPCEGKVLGVLIWEGTAIAFRKKTGVNEIGIFKESASGWVEITVPGGEELTYTGISDHNFRSDTYNFYATVASGTGSVGKEIYWVDGVNKCRKYNGTSVVIVSNAGMDPNDAPILVKAHQNRLFLGYRLGSLQYSSIGAPTDWVTSSGEIGIGKEMTNLVEGVAGTLVIFCGKIDGAIKVLHGSSVSTFSLQTHSDRSGGYEDTAKRMFGTIFFMDDRGVSTLDAVQEFGDYASNSISDRVKRTLLTNKDVVTSAIQMRDLNQYRLFFSTGYGLVFSFKNKRYVGATLIKYPSGVLSVVEGEDVNGDPLVLFTTNSGYVYQMDSGTSFDGTQIDTSLTTAYYHYGSPRNWKTFYRITPELAAIDAMSLGIQVNFDYKESASPRSIEEDIDISGSASRWGTGIWGTFVWGGAEITNRLQHHIRGIGTNMSVSIRSSETYTGQHTLQNFITDYSVGGIQI